MTFPIYTLPANNGLGELTSHMQTPAVGIVILNL